MNKQKPQRLRLKKQYQSYPEYQDSGVEWLGKIPEGWEVNKVKNIIPLQIGWTPPTGNSEYYEGDNLWVNISDLDQKVINDTENKISDIAVKEARIKLVPTGSLLYSFKLSVGKSAFAGKPLYTNEAIAAFLPNKRSEISFLYYLFSVSLINSANENIYGAKLLNQSIIKNCVIPIPPKNEQSVISHYLDEKTTLIEKIIEKKQRLIELLQKKRTAVINRAVITIGKEERLKFSIVVNPSKQEVSHLPQDFEVSFVPMECLSVTGEITPLEKKYSEVKEGFTYFKTGDVTLAKITPCFENGKAGVILDLKNGIGFGTTEFIVLRPNQKVLPKYIYYLIFSDKFRRIGEVEMRGSAGQKRVPEAYVSNYRFNRPSVEEQKRIVRVLDYALAGLDIALNKIQKSIDLLQEFKISLIFYTVTGKMKVSNFENND